MRRISQIGLRSGEGIKLVSNAFSPLWGPLKRTLDACAHLLLCYRHSSPHGLINTDSGNIVSSRYRDLMGRARQQLTAPAYQREGFFNTVLGRGRGLDAVAQHQRDFDAIDFNSLLNDPDINVLAEHFYRYRELSNDQFLRFHKFLAQRLAADLLSDWTHAGMNMALTALGLSTNERSPWLLASKEAKPSDAGPDNHTVIHIADWRADGPWVASTSVLEERRKLRSLCGLDFTFLKNLHLSSSRTPDSYSLPRGAWQNPQAVGGSRCRICAAIAEDMVIPALNENGEDLFRSRLFMIASHLLIESALSALNNSSDFAEARGTLNPEARDSVLNRLNQIAHNDPIPIFMHTLAVDERERLAPVSQPNLHAYLIGFDWLTALNTALPAEPADIFDSLSLHASLLAYTQRIDVSLHL